MSVCLSVGVKLLNVPLGGGHMSSVLCGDAKIIKFRLLKAHDLWVLKIQKSSTQKNQTASYSSFYSSYSSPLHILAAGDFWTALVEFRDEAKL